MRRYLWLLFLPCMLSATVEWYGRDALLVHHGGQEYAELSAKERVVLFGQVHYLTLGDSVELSEQQEWTLVKRDPDALTFRSDGRELKVERQELQWDLESVRSQLGVTRKVGDDAFALELAQRTVLVRPGDWLYVDRGRWRRVQTAQELDAIVANEIGGPLLIVEKIVFERGAPALQLQVIDPMRGALHPLIAGTKRYERYQQHKQNRIIKDAAMEREKAKFHRNQERLRRLDHRTMSPTEYMRERRRVIRRGKID